MGLFSVVESLVERRLRPLELVEDAVERLGAADASLNFVESLWVERARRRAEQLEGSVPSPSQPLCGVPVLAKAGMELGRGIAGLVEDLGAVVVGTARASERGWRAETTDGERGPVRNPRDPSRGVGGSCGGSAVAVAVDAVPLALGNDAGGSLRIPASYVGLPGVCVRPWRLGDGWRVSEGVFAHTLQETAFVLDYLVQHEGRARLLSSFAAGVVAPRRLGVWSRPAGGRDLQPRVAEAFEGALDVLAAAGVELVEVSQHFEAPWLELLEARQALEVVGALARGEELRDPALRRLAERPLEELLASLEPLERAVADGRARVRRCLDEVDAVIAPVARCEAPRALDPIALDKELGRDARDPIGFTYAANLAGLAAVSVPLVPGPRSPTLGIQALAVREVSAIAAASWLARHLSPEVLSAPPVPW